MTIKMTISNTPQFKKNIRIENSEKPNIRKNNFNLHPRNWSRDIEIRRIFG